MMRARGESGRLVLATECVTWISEDDFLSIATISCERESIKLSYCKYFRIPAPTYTRSLLVCTSLVCAATTSQNPTRLSMKLEH